MGAASHVGTARAMFLLAVQDWPKDWIIIRQGSLVIADSGEVRN